MMAASVWMPPGIVDPSVLQSQDTQGAHIHTQSSTRRHSRAAIAVGSCCNQTSKRLGKGRNTCAFCHSSCVPPLCLGHTAASGLPTTHSSSCVHSHPPTANSMATQPRLSCGQPTPAASGCVCVCVDRQGKAMKAAAAVCVFPLHPPPYVSVEP